MKPSPMLVVDPDKQEISKGKIIIVDLYLSSSCALFY